MNVGPPEIILILAVALLIFGPARLPQMGRTLGKALREFRNATDEIKGSFSLLDDDDHADAAQNAAAADAGAPSEADEWAGVGVAGGAGAAGAAALPAGDGESSEDAALAPGGGEPATPAAANAPDDVARPDGA